jgi:hypothetical protein
MENNINLKNKGWFPNNFGKMKNPSKTRHLVNCKEITKEEIVDWPWISSPF